MPVFEIQFKAELENVEFLEPIKSNLFKFNVGNGSGEERNNVTVSTDDIYELEGSKGTANYIMKWDKKDQHQAYMKILEVLPYTKSNEFATIMKIECRGLEVTKYIPTIDFHAVSGESNYKFESIDLSELEWSEYNEQDDVAVSVMNIETRVIKA